MPPPQELLPGERRTVSIQLDDLWPTFAVPLTISLTPTAMSLDGEESSVAPIAEDLVVWAVPVPQLLTLLALLLIVGAVIGGRIHGKRKTQRLVDEAREEGRRAAAAEGGSTTG